VLRAAVGTKSHQHGPEARTVNERQRL